MYSQTYHLIAREQRGAAGLLHAGHEAARIEKLPPPVRRFRQFGRRLADRPAFT